MPPPTPPVDGSPEAGGPVGWLDLSAGVAGDMLLGAVVGAGADIDGVQRLVDLVLPDTVRLDVHAVTRGGLRATKVDVVPLVADQHHRPWAQIRELLVAAPDELPTPVREDALRVFEQLATVEGAVHGIATDDVELHEVGSWDSVADVVGTCAGLHLLGVSDLLASPLSLGSGSVRTDHGVLPVPVPAVLGLVDGWSVVGGGDGELSTPTGVALVTTLAAGQGGMPPMRVSGSGVGAGSRDTPGRPNVVRLVLGHREPARHPETDGHTEMAVLEANVDDLDPRVWPTVLSALLDVGAADAWLVPVVMKKGRPAHVLTVLCEPDAAPGLRAQVLDLTTTLGVRQSTVQRWALQRGWADVDVDGQRVAVKVGHRDGEIVHATAEFEDVAAAAAALQRPVQAVVVAAAAAATTAGLSRGRLVPEGLRPAPGRQP